MSSKYSLARPTCTSHVRIQSLPPGKVKFILSKSPSAVRTRRMGNCVGSFMG